MSLWSQSLVDVHLELNRPQMHSESGNRLQKAKMFTLKASKQRSTNHLLYTVYIRCHCLLRYQVTISHWLLNSQTSFPEVAPWCRSKTLQHWLPFSEPEFANSPVCMLADWNGWDTSNTCVYLAMTCQDGAIKRAYHLSRHKARGKKKRENNRSREPKRETRGR